MKKLVLIVSVFLLSVISLSIKASEKPSYQALSETTREVAQQYFDAYIALNWKALEPLLSSNGSFEDPTAEFVFGVVKREGKQAVMKGFEEGYAAIVKMKFHSKRASFSGQHAIFEGDLQWSMKLAGGKLVEIESMPFTSILKIEDRKVVSHTDYADYGPFFIAYQNALKKDQ